MQTDLPPTAELFTVRQLAERHPHLLNLNRILWAVRHRSKNGLSTARAVFDSPCGTLLVHEPAFLSWFLGLAGRSKPRSLGRRAKHRPAQRRGRGALLASTAAT